MRILSQENIGQIDKLFLESGLDGPEIVEVFELATEIVTSKIDKKALASIVDSAETLIRIEAIHGPRVVEATRRFGSIGIRVDDALEGLRRAFGRQR